MRNITITAVVAAVAFVATPSCAQEQPEPPAEETSTTDGALDTAPPPEAQDATAESLEMEAVEADAGAMADDAEDMAEMAEDTAAAETEGEPADAPETDASPEAAMVDEVETAAAAEGDMVDVAVEEAMSDVDPEILAYLEAGDAEAGERTFRLCMACHTLEAGANRVGPSLHGIIGRTAGTVEGFRYSPANQESGVTWTKDQLFVYLENPQAFIPRTIMAFAGIPKPEDRANVIAYIAANGGKIDPAAE